MNTDTTIASVLVKPVSADCNLDCEYCFYSSKSAVYPESKQHHMSDHVLRELVAQFMALCQERASFSWQGGEPTLAGLGFYRKVVEYQSLFRAQGQLVENSLQTNGTLIDENWAKFLVQHNFLVGVSLDGPPEFHNHYRKDRMDGPSYNRVFSGIECLKRYDVDFNILAVLNNRNTEHPKELYRFLLSQGFRYLQFIPCVEVDPVKSRVADYSITPEQYGRFLRAVFDEWTRDGVPQVYIREFDELLIRYVLGETPSCEFSPECGKYVVVEYNGDVYPCDFFVEKRWLLGNIKEQRLEDIITSKKLEEFKYRKINITRKCKDCSWVKYCYGGCPRHWIPSGLEENYFCSSYRSFFEYSHERFISLKHLVKNRVSNI